ncbi:PGR5-like protein 1B, chloroplastic [Glycine max]|nr:PGR5-like protein 1B, chloroplastic [Glycine max]
MKVKVMRVASSSSSNGLSVVAKMRRSSSVSLFSVRACHDLPHGPSCIYVGPLHTATQETLEALYSQARDAYYSGEPLILDDMFDRLELKLKWYGSKSVVKYPRCSIRRHSTYADADEDLSMAIALASLWSLFLALGCSACVSPIFYTVSTAYHRAFDSGLSYGSPSSSGLGLLFVVNSIIFMALGFVIGYPVASASEQITLAPYEWRCRHVFDPDEGDIVVLDEKTVELQRTITGGEAEVAEFGDRMRHAARALIVGKVVATLEESIDGVRESRNSEVVVVGEGNEVAREVRSQLTVFNFVGELELKADLHEIKVLQGLWRNDLAALKGSCPNCGEEVFAFVRTDKANNSPHRADCHVCECLLEFRTEVEQSALRLGRQWVYGRIYLVRRSRRQREP